MRRDSVQIRNQEIPTMNYVWVGPPAAQSTSGQPGSDVAYVIEMMKTCKNPANYFCLEQHVEHFRKVFDKQQVKINVVSIEGFINEMSRSQDTEISGYAKQMLEIMKIQLSPPRNEIRDRVTFKEIFTFLLLAAQGGYTMDTNLKIVDSVNSFYLPPYDCCKAPYNMKADKPALDVFFMYAPRDNHDQAKKMIGYYLSHWSEAQRELNCSKDDIIRIGRIHNAMMRLTIHSVSEGLKSTGDQAADLQLDPAWRFSALSPDEFALPRGAVHAVRLEGLPIIKVFSNSHKPEYEAKKLILNKIENYKKANPALGKYKQPLIALLEQERACYDELEPGRPNDVMRVNRRLYDMVEVFSALDEIVVEASKAGAGLRGFFNRFLDEPVKDMDARLGLLYESAAKIVSDSLAESGSVDKQKVKELFQEFKQNDQAPASAQGKSHTPGK